MSDNNAPFALAWIGIQVGVKAGVFVAGVAIVTAYLFNGGIVDMIGWGVAAWVMTVLLVTIIFASIGVYYPKDEIKRAFQ